MEKRLRSRLLHTHLTREADDTNSAEMLFALSVEAIAQTHTHTKHTKMSWQK